MAFKIYTAGWSVFRADAISVGLEFSRFCQQNGAIALYPLSEDVSLALDPADPRGNARKIFKANIAKIQEADAIVADMSSFRGPGMDGGTAFEIGVAFIAGKPIVGYGPSQSYKEKVVAWSAHQSPGWSAKADPDSGATFDHNDLLIEDFGGVENLMMTQAIDDYAHSFEEAVLRVLDILDATPSIPIKNGI